MINIIDVNIPFLSSDHHETRGDRCASINRTNPMIILLISSTSRRLYLYVISPVDCLSYIIILYHIMYVV